MIPNEEVCKTNNVLLFLTHIVTKIVSQSGVPNKCIRYRLANSTYSLKLGLWKISPNDVFIYVVNSFICILPLCILIINLAKHWLTYLDNSSKIMV